MNDPTDIVQTKTTRRARTLLRIIAAFTGQPMQNEAERIFSEELERVNHIKEIKENDKEK